MKAASLAVAAALAAALCAPLAAQQPVSGPRASGALLRGLDKFSGLTNDFEAVLNAPVRYARLSIVVHACVGAGDDASAHLEITDLKTPDAPVFVGWMMAASPALSALDHPRYDVWVLACRTSSGVAP
ncbi:DUF2155 domain-containing protein [Rubrimonas cliftonensis]|uniref:DUF2155 domain-containing protein n=1 Tax=Rubrimonas cliftonensis TaxID=89524 RepID=A0A1H3YJW2_9RHOB|nr:DUF2155 domain-containing protein [Rubrimonas cliftonensis]SEA11294.1 hypothetical protein SAMN05444370_103113 [Rubrimonas cliftonensis]